MKLKPSAQIFANRNARCYTGSRDHTRILSEIHQISDRQISRIFDARISFLFLFSGSFSRTGILEVSYRRTPSSRVATSGAYTPIFEVLEFLIRPTIPDLANFRRAEPRVVARIFVSPISHVPRYSVPAPRASNFSSPKYFIFVHRFGLLIDPPCRSRARDALLKLSYDPIRFNCSTYRRSCNSPIPQHRA